MGVAVGDAFVRGAASCANVRHGVHRADANKGAGDRRSSHCLYQGQHGAGFQQLCVLHHGQRGYGAVRRDTWPHQCHEDLGRHHRSATVHSILPRHEPPLSSNHFKHGRTVAICEGQRYAPWSVCSNFESRRHGSQRLCSKHFRLLWRSHGRSRGYHFLQVPVHNGS